MSSTPGYVFLIVVQNASRSMNVARNLTAALAHRLDGTPVIGVDLYHRRETDVALLGLRLDMRFTTRALLGDLTDLATRAGQAVLEPSRLPAPELERFHNQYLPKYDLRVADLPGVEDALRVLGERFGLAGPTPRPAESLSGERLEVRFRRGDDWQLGRVRSLSSEAIYVSTGGPPRRGDVVEVELAYHQTSHHARATVVHVTPAEAAAALGAAGFGARFLAADANERQKLMRFLASLRGVVPAGLAPPPRRRDVRYPVRWPVYIGSQGAARTTSALDVSRHGMFIASDSVRAEGTQLDITVPLDDNGAPLRTRARVARTVGQEQAQQRGVPTGLGLEITGLSQRDEGRFLRFLARIGKRAGFTIVVGASTARAAQITSELIAAGYAAAGASDAPTLISKAAAAARAPDLVMIDVSLTRGDIRAENAVRRALSVRAVPMLQVDETTPQGARSLADVALLS